VFAPFHHPSFAVPQTGLDGWHGGKCWMNALAESTILRHDWKPDLG